MLTQLPHDITLKILSSLPIYTVGRLSRVCKELSKLTYSYDCVWKWKFEMLYGGRLEEGETKT